MTDRSVYNALKRIELVGLVEIARSRGRNSNHYQALLNHEVIASRLNVTNHETNNANEPANREAATSHELVEIDKNVEGLVFQDRHQPCFLCERNSRPVTPYHGQLFCKPCLEEYTRPALASWGPTGGKIPGDLSLSVDREAGLAAAGLTSLTSFTTSRRAPRRLGRAGRLSREAPTPSRDGSRRAGGSSRPGAGNSARSCPP